MIRIYLYFDPENKISAERKAKKMQKQGYNITEQKDNFIKLEK